MLRDADHSCRQAACRKQAWKKDVVLEIEKEKKRKKEKPHAILVVWIQIADDYQLNPEYTFKYYYTPKSSGRD